MKSKFALLAISALLLGGCSSGNGKTKIGVLQFGSFDALQKATDGFVNTLNASDIKDKIEITLCFRCREDTFITLDSSF